MTQPTHPKPMENPTPAQIDALAAAIRAADHYRDKDPDKLAEDILKHWQPPVDESGTMLQSELEALVKIGFIPLCHRDRTALCIIESSKIVSMTPRKNYTHITVVDGEYYEVTESLSAIIILITAVKKFQS
jgi:hypothetical protein